MKIKLSQESFKTFIKEKFFQSEMESLQATVTSIDYQWQSKDQDFLSLDQIVYAQIHKVRKFSS